MRVPPSLEPVVGSALGRAAAQRHPKTTVFHLLAALLEDAETSEIVRRAGGALSDLKALVAARLQEVPQPTLWERITSAALLHGTVIEPAFRRSIVGAMRHVRSASQRDARPPDILAALFRLGGGHVKELLTVGGLTRLQVVRSICHSHDVDRDRLLDTPPAGPCEVIVLNDDYTEMKTVVDILRKVFELEAPRAYRTMMTVHFHGSAALGPYPGPLAAELVARAMRMAEAREAPLGVQLRAVVAGSSEVTRA